MDLIYKSLTDPSFIFAALVGVAVFATIFTVMMPMLGGSGLEARMKNVLIAVCLMIFALPACKSKPIKRKRKAL